jgi:hypothetical protein
MPRRWQITGRKENPMAKFTSTQLQKSINTSLEELASLLDAAKFSQEIQSYLDTIAKFHHYSIYNQLLIYWANPSASHVAGFCTWRDQFNRTVKKGEKGIPILAPVRVKVDPQNEEDEPEHKLFFKVVYVFDISQTEGDEVPALDVWKSPEYRPELQKVLINYAESIGLKVKVGDIGEAQGSLTSDHQIFLNASAGTKTLVHEIAHFLANHLETSKPHAQRELEAEATAYAVCCHFGFDDLKSPNYLYLSGLKADDLKASLTTISILAQQIINQIEERIK